jgi:hypothetical protein
MSENHNEPRMYVVLYGNPIHGFEVYGPFASYAKAVAFGKEEVEAYVSTEWWIMPLHAPKGDK